MNQSSQPFWPSPNVRGEDQPELASTPTAKRTFGQTRSQQQQQLLTPRSSSSSSSQYADDEWSEGFASTDDRRDTQSDYSLPVQPGGLHPQQHQRRYISHPGISTRQQVAAAPAPYQSNGNRRRRTQTELLMHHGIAWLGYGTVIPNVSVVTGEPLVYGPVPTHGTRRTGGGQQEGGEEYGDDEDSALAARASRALTIEVNKRAAKGHKAPDYRRA
ncbi:hypothetical protein J7T55_001883 [Diaporthe amygdali]|uniref:uncharacterized protein n=1 Tax=Phomopsis amygdali TaxID=1214568 RepID=UPI0022FE9ABB|nr:uncharacterized protein J7T55_001883 [Diaporthe amygdali]KAJ0117684.1 hypothetical protein J7T55_001883 [Diaporthe amygdali]